MCKCCPKCTQNSSGPSCTLPVSVPSFNASTMSAPPSSSPARKTKVLISNLLHLEFIAAMLLSTLFARSKIISLPDREPSPKTSRCIFGTASCPQRCSAQKTQCTDHTSISRSSLRGPKCLTTLIAIARLLPHLASASSSMMS